jgi:hypothetical protein
MPTTEPKVTARKIPEEAAALSLGSMEAWRAIKAAL